MVSLCGSNLIPILITILSCAGLFMYFNLRLSEIKSIVEKQNRVLTSFITNVQQEIKGGSMPQPSHSLATPEALAAAKKFETERVSGDKIVVSDDEEDDDYDDSDDDSDSESDASDAESEPEDIKIEIPVENRIPIPISFEVLSYVVSDSSAQSSANESSITEIIDEPAVEELITQDTITEDTITEDTITEAIATDEHYEQLKVDELRKVVSDKNLATKEEVKKLKKPELLVLLKK